MNVKGRGNGPQAYLGAFADSTAGDPPLAIGFDPDVIAERIAANKPPPAWTRALEQQFYLYLGTLSADEYLLQWSSYPSAPNDVTDGNPEILYREYTLTATPSGGLPDTIGIGRADLYLFKTPNGPPRWTITAWVDHLDPAYPAADAAHRSFSRLRIDSTGR